LPDRQLCRAIQHGRDNPRPPSHIPQFPQPYCAVFRPQHHPEVPQFYEFCDAEREAAVYDGDKHWVVRRVCGDQRRVWLGTLGSGLCVPDGV
ncbi:hypothetical protein C0993_012513, partial [Termitomyces sp. T159_Od127]